MRWRPPNVSWCLFTAAELAHIQRTASLAQTGRMPTDPHRLARMLELSSVTREFVCRARHMVLRLCGELRSVTAEHDNLAAELERLREQVRS